MLRPDHYQLNIEFRELLFEPFRICLNKFSDFRKFRPGVRKHQGNFTGQFILSVRLAHYVRQDCTIQSAAE